MTSLNELEVLGIGQQFKKGHLYYFEKFCIQGKNPTV